jgi:hypothetical protein
MATAWWRQEYNEDEEIEWMKVVHFLRGAFPACQAYSSRKITPPRDHLHHTFIVVPKTLFTEFCLLYYQHFSGGASRTSVNLKT